MAKCSKQVPLPLSVETLIEEICQKHNQPPLNPTLRLKLADIGEQRALQILNQIRKSGIKTSFSGFIKVMIDESPSSSSKSYKEQVPLPTKVESLIEQICNEQKKPPLDSGVRRKLAAIGEQRALDILNYIQEKEIEKSFGGFVICMLKDLPSSSSPSPPQYASTMSVTNDNTEDSVTLSLSTHQGCTRGQIVVKDDEKEVILSLEAMVISKPKANRN